MGHTSYDDHFNTAPTYHWLSSDDAQQISQVQSPQRGTALFTAILEESFPVEEAAAVGDERPPVFELEAPESRVRLVVSAGTLLTAAFLFVMVRRRSAAIGLCPPEC